MKITLFPTAAQGETKIECFKYDQESIPSENVLLSEASFVCSCNMPATVKTKIFRSEKRCWGETLTQVFFCPGNQRGRTLTFFKFCIWKESRHKPSNMAPGHWENSKEERSFSPSLHPSLLKQAIKPRKNLWPSPLRHAVKPRWPSPEAVHKPFIPKVPSLYLEEDLAFSVRPLGHGGECEQAGLFKAPSWLMLGHTP